MAEVTIREVRKSFGPVEVLHGVSIDIDDGEFVVLVGPSGCGKSTLLRMIAGLEEITPARSPSAARVVNDVPPKERDIAMVFQNYALYPHMTVADEHGVLADAEERAEGRDRGAGATAPPRSSASRRCLDRYPRQLSGGQRQRVAMGRAIVRDPQVFLFDEPLSNLDAKLRVAMRAEIKEPAPAAEDHHGLRHPRPDRGDDHGRQDRGHARRPRRADRRAARPLRPAGQPLRRRLHRLAGDELAARAASTPTAAARFLTGDGMALPLDRPAASQRPKAGDLRHAARASAPRRRHPARRRRGRADRRRHPVIGRLGGDRHRRRVPRAPSPSRRASTIRLAVDPGAVHLFDAATGARIAA